MSSGKLAQARALGARVLEVRGSFDEALSAARALADRGTHVLVNSLNPDRLEGQKTAAFEIVEELDSTPDVLALPYGGGGNLTAYARGFAESGGLPRLVAGEAADRATTVASAIRIGIPAHAVTAAEALHSSGGAAVSLTDEEILEAWRELARDEGRLLRAVVRRRARGARLGRAGARLDRRVRRHRARAQGSGVRRAPQPRAPRGGPRPRCDRGGVALTAVRVRAPASTANIGPGFDCAAVALDLWNELEVTEGADAADLDHLGVQAFARLAPVDGRAYTFVDRIPRERGLGSSAAVIALGLAAANAVADLGLGPEELLAQGVELEGHADNLAAALAGGVCLTWDVKIARVADDVPAVPIALVPEATVSTAAARAALPDSVAHDDATFTAGRAALLGAALASGSSELFAEALADRIHEPYRAEGAPLLACVRERASRRRARLHALRLGPDGRRLGSPRVRRGLLGGARDPLPRRRRPRHASLSPRSPCPVSTDPYTRATDPAKRHSAALTDGPDRAGARSMLKGTGFTDDDLAKPIIGVATTWIETMPCNLNQRELAVHVKRGIRDAGATPMEFNTIAVSDGVSMGTSGMRASLVSREVIADSIELVARGHLFDGLVCLVACDKTTPGAIMALGRLDIRLSCSTRARSRRVSTAAARCRSATSTRRSAPMPPGR